MDMGPPRDGFCMVIMNDEENWSNEKFALSSFHRFLFRQQPMTMEAGSSEDFLNTFLSFPAFLSFPLVYAYNEFT